ncbi:BTAD domain-containing putative transcriptional regulator [Rhodococcus triatomae]
MQPDSIDLAQDAPAGVVVGLLGPVVTRRGGDLAVVAGSRARSLLVALARRPGSYRSAAALIEDVWGDEPPRSPANALHTQISRLRGVLPDGAVESGPAGYRLTLTRTQVDLTLARALEQQAQQCHADGDHRGAVDTARRARSLWRGDPGGDLPAGELAEGLAAEAAARADALDAVELAALVTGGEARQALPLARSVAARRPLDEQAHGQLMLALAEAGLTGEAHAVFADLRARLAQELGADPSPHLVALNTALLTGGAVVPEPVTVEPEPHALPGPTTSAIGLRAAPNSLIGRDADIAAVEHLLASGRVVTVLGPGGTGKTRLAHELGRRAVGARAVTLVELAALRSGADVVAAISATLGVGEVELAPGTDLTRVRVHDARSRLRDALGSRPSLLILDNCEHLIDDVADVVADLVAATDQLTVLATSRAPMAITAEAVYPLPPLTVNEKSSPATELFRVRARSVRPSVQLDDAEVARLCRTLDGLPLAIELAAARVRTMTVEDINARLTDRFALLRAGDRTSPQRHRTLHAVIEWSWNLLDLPQRSALRRLCRFPGGFTLDAATAVAERGDVDNVVDAVEGLVNQSLLTVVENGTGLRYHMLETVREFGEEQLALAGSGEGDAVADRMRTWAANFALRALRGFLDGDQLAVTHRVEAEHDNLVAALRQALAVRDAPAALSVFPVLAASWSLRGAHSEVSVWSSRLRVLDLRAASARVPGNALAVSYLLIGAHAAFSADLRTLAGARVRLRGIVRTRDDLDPVVALSASLVASPVSGRGLARMLAGAVRDGDRPVRTIALLSRANLRENMGDLRGSAVDARAALRLAREAGETWTTASVCQHLGSLEAQTARYDAALDHYREAAEMMSGLHAFDESVALYSYTAACLVGLGRLDEARRELERAAPLLAMVEEVPVGPVRGGQASVAVSRAELDLASGDVDGGLRGYRQALDLTGVSGALGEADPFATMVLAAVVDAHVLAGRAAEITATVDMFLARALGELGPGGHSDLPQTGAVACAIGSHDIALGHESGLRMLVLATRVAPRQDFPSMQVSRHLDRARAALGSERVDAALAEAARVPRSTAREEIVEALRARA